MWRMNREVLNWGKKAEHSLLKAALGQPVTVNENRRWCCFSTLQEKGREKLKND